MSKFAVNAVQQIDSAENAGQDIAGQDNDGQTSMA